MQDLPVLTEDSSHSSGIRRLATKQETTEFLQSVERQIRYAEPLALLREGQRTMAAQEFEALLKQDPDDFRAAHHLAVLYHGWAMELEEDAGSSSDMAHWRNGLRYWHRVWKADGFWEALKVKGAALGQDFKDDTVQQLRDDLPGRLLRLHGAYVTYWIESGDTDRAKQHLDIILKSLFPNPVRQAVREEIAGPYLEEAERQRERGNYEEAMEGLELWLSVDEKHADARKKAGDVYNIHGVKLHSQGRLTEARRCFERALHFDPKHEAAKRNLDQLKQRDIQQLLALLGR